MKNSLIIVSLVLLFSLFQFNGFAQLKVYPQNKVHIGAFWSNTFPGQADEWLYVNGGINVSCLPASSGFSFIRYPYNANGNTYNLPALIPQWPSSMLLGNSEFPLFEVYSTYLYTQNAAVFALSDSGYKVNFRPNELDSNYKKLKLLKTYKYDYNRPKVLNNSSKSDSIPQFHSGQNQFGFKAQEIQALFPQLVHKNNSTNQYYVNYMGLIPILTEAIKKQSIELESLRSRLDSLEKK